MTVKEIVGKIGCSTDYKLVGAMTGKTLAKSWSNRKEYIEQYHDCYVPSIYTGFRLRSDDDVISIICIYVSGK